MSQKYSLPEIERRWLVPADRLPDLSAAHRREIEDKYIQGGRLRLRAVTAENSETVFKLGKKYPRVGVEAEQVVSVYLTKEEYEALHKLPGAMARKTRYAWEGGALDVYEHPAARPSIFEVEFQSATEAAAYAPPRFVGEEVTFNAGYTGHALAQ